MWCFAYFLESEKALELPQDVVEHPQNYCIRMTGYTLNFTHALISQTVFVYCNIVAKNFSVNGNWRNIVGTAHASGGKPGRSNQRLPHPVSLDLEISGGLSSGLKAYCDPPVNKGIIYFNIVRKERIK